MKTKLMLLTAALGLTATMTQANLISEFQPNPVGADPSNVDFEISGTASTGFDLWVLSLESDPTSIGAIDRASNITGTYDANGIAVASIPDLENPSFTVLLVSGFTGSLGDDLDTNDDGTLDLTPWTSVEDALGITDNTGDFANLYGAQVGGVDFAYTGDEPGLVFRGASTGSWYAVNDPVGTDVYDSLGNTFALTDFTSDPSATTFGSINPDVIPEPSVAALALIGLAFLIHRFRRK